MVVIIDAQWNPSIYNYSGHPWGTINVLRGKLFIWDLHGCQAVISQLAFIQGWPLRGVPLYTASGNERKNVRQFTKSKEQVTHHSSL